MVLFFDGDLEDDTGKGTANGCVDLFTGERVGEEGRAGSLTDVAADGEQEARVRVRAETLGADSSGMLARGTFGRGSTPSCS